jgi:TRAP-type C4-dicarboxylate transport system permease small subunit
MSEPDPRDAAPTRFAGFVRIADHLSAVSSWLAGAALVLLALNIFSDVVGRAFFKAPLQGTLEMTANWWMPTLTLLAFGITEVRQEHIKVTILLDALPLRMRQIVEGSFGILTVGLLIVLTYYTLQDALESAAYGQTTAGFPPIAIWPFKFVAVAGVAILAVQAAASAFRSFAGLLPAPDATDTDVDVV